MTINGASILRSVAQSMRHAPGLRTCRPLWDALRRPYGAALGALSAGRGIPLRIGGQTIRLDPAYVNLNWETVEVEAYRVFATLVQPGDVVYDVGAHFGTYSVIAARRGGAAGRVVAYEPAALTRTYLERHLAWNGVRDRVTVRPLCCGDRVGPIELYIKPGVPEGIHSLLPAPDLEPVLVGMTTIDVDAAAIGSMPAVVKIDVEGAELAVLQGAERVLRAALPRVLISLHPRRLAQLGLAPADITAWLTARDYRCDLVAEDQEIHVLATAAMPVRGGARRCA